MRAALLTLALLLPCFPAAPATEPALHGSVRDGGHPAQAYVYAIPLRPSLDIPASTISRPDGTYLFLTLPPGDYRLVASVYPEQIPYRDPEALKPWLLRGRALKLAPGVSVTLDLQVEPYD